MLRSGWLNGKWRENVRLRSSMMRNCGKHRDHLAEPIAPFDIFPLNVPAPRWRYHEGLPGALEGRIATQTLADGTRIADLTILAEVQLQDIPRFSSEDGTIFFFHRVEPNVGPEYAPSMTYGLLSKTHVHYFNLHGSLCEKPIALGTTQGDGVIQETSQSPFSKGITIPRLHPTLREAQLFAGLEAYGLKVGPGNVKSPKMPDMIDIEFGQSHKFGYGLGALNDSPISVGLPFPHVEVWSRIDDEEDDPIDNRAAILGFE